MARKKPQPKARLPKGTMFMPGTSYKKLAAMHKKEKNPLAKTRLALALDVKEGTGIRKACRKHRVEYSTGRTWLYNLHVRGLDARYNKKSPGKQPRLDKEEMKQAKKDLKAGPRKFGFRSSVWTGKIFLLYIKLKFGVEYSPNHAYKLFKKLRISRKKPRPRHPNTISKLEEEQYRKNARRRFLRRSKKGYAILSADEMTCVLNDIPTHDWCEIGSRPTAPITLSSGERTSIFGALANDRLICMYADKLGSDHFIEFIDYVHSKVGKFSMSLDNASYHKSLKVRKHIEKKYGSDVILDHLPPYSPQLCSMETQWTHFHKHSRNTYYESSQDLQEDLICMVKNGEIPIVKMQDYMLV